jgi:hypothetical protein
MYERRFTGWESWGLRNQLAGLAFPGVYAIALSEAVIKGEPFSWRSEIVYIGMTNSPSGLKGRLKQFDNTILGKVGHGGADRVRFKHRNYARLKKHLYVAVAAFKCNPNSTVPTILRTKGEVAKFEYSCFAHFTELFDDLPEFNRSTSLKYSRSTQANDRT